MPLTIAILMGGKSRERGPSLKTGKAASKALARLSYTTVEIDYDDTDDIVEELKTINPDLAFIALHDSQSENSKIQGLLDILGIKYTHSGVLASAIAGNKVMSKHIFQSIGIDTPKGYVINREDVLQNNIKMEYPYVLKPIDEGASVGVYIILSYEDYLKLKSDPSEIREKMIIEEYVPGVDLLTAVLLDEAVGTIEVRPKIGFFDYTSKTKAGLADTVFPADIPDDIYKKTLELALKAHRFLDCKSVSRSDFRYNPEDNTLKMLELNTHPTIFESTTVQKIVEQTKGFNCDELVNIIVKNSL